MAPRTRKTRKIEKSVQESYTSSALKDSQEVLQDEEELEEEQNEEQNYEDEENPENTSKTENPEEPEALPDVYMTSESENSESEGFSTSSSEAEDSEDDYELEIGLKPRVKKTIDSGTSDTENEGIDELRDIEKRMERELKKNRLMQKRRRDEEAKDDGIICEFESSVYKKNRKRRMFRRRIMRPPGEKRRRIRRANVDMTDVFSCETFADPPEDAVTLKVNVDLEEPDIDDKELKKVFKVMKLGHLLTDDESEEEDDADITAKKINFYDARNAKERVRQITNLDISPFVDKLSGIESHKAEQGSVQSRIQNYHPNIFKEEPVHRLPEGLIWETDFSHLIYGFTEFDAHAKTRELLDTAAAERTATLKQQLLEEFNRRFLEKKAQRAGFEDQMVQLEQGAGHSGMLDYDGNRSNDEMEQEGEELFIFEDDNVQILEFS